jgi:hypothetical protein
VKTCTKCKKDLELDKFTKDSSKKDGLYPSCKKCRKSYVIKARANNPDKFVEYNRKYRKKNLEKVRQWDRERSKLPKRRAYLNSRQRYYLVKYRSLGKTFQKQTEQIYLKSLELGPEYEVDHIVPLNGENVSGLHVPWNLRIVSVFENRSKGNKY